MSTIASVTVIGAGNIGAAVAGIALKAGAPVQVLARDAAKASAIDPRVTAGTIGDAITGDIVVLALPYPAYADVLAAYPQGLAGKVVVDPSNPIDFATFDSVLEPGSSAASELATRLPGAAVVKAFNTNFAATLASGVAGDAPTTVLLAGDDEAKSALSAIIVAAGLRAADAGALKRAVQLEAVGALQIALALGGQSAGGFVVLP